MSGPRYNVILERESDGIWSAEVPALGIVTEGRGESGARKAADRAIEGYIVGAQRHGLTLPDSDTTITYTFEVPRGSIDLSFSSSGTSSGARRKSSGVVGRRKSTASSRKGGVARTRKAAGGAKKSAAKKRTRKRSELQRFAYRATGYRAPGGAGGPETRDRTARRVANTAAAFRGGGRRRGHLCLPETRPQR